MGRLLDKFVGEPDSIEENEYDSVDYTNESLGINPDNLIVKTAEINGKMDMLTVEESLRSGDLVIADIGNLNGGLTKDEIYSFLKDAVEEVSGDIVERENRELILCPSDVEVSREKLC